MCGREIFDEADGKVYHTPKSFEFLIRKEVFI